MTIVEYFSFLPYGKYAFYVWSAYGIAFITVATLFIRARSNHKQTLINLNSKYSRQDD
ncbi:MAG TPA: heme exporter protein CcmD [Candidatus Thioglobus sp.]|jgi:heme exporter protein D|nr:heme exporter protein CcmD [Candidatus Thioglobus sp.]HIL20408.1 heme exporter protein CcmD [Candidatus Thioglobus sp.]